MRVPIQAAHSNDDRTITPRGLGAGCPALSALSVVRTTSANYDVPLCKMTISAALKRRYEYPCVSTARYEVPAPQDHGFLGCVAVQHRDSSGTKVDRSSRTQWNVIHQPLGYCRDLLLRPRRIGH